MVDERDNSPQAQIKFDCYTMKVEYEVWYLSETCILQLCQFVSGFFPLSFLMMRHKQVLINYPLFINLIPGWVFCHWASLQIPLQRGKGEC